MSRAITLEDALGQQVSVDTLNAAMTSGFAETLNLELVQGNLSPAEVSRSEELRQTKYASHEWTERL
jgi:lipoate-protein ligase A